MGIALVPRGVRALAEQLNGYYRVFKGVDPDTVTLRLNPGGAFQVRHSSTNTPVFTVTDEGASVVIGAEDIADRSVTEPKLADKAVSNRALGDYCVTTDKIYNETILNEDIAAKTIRGGVDGPAGRIANLSIVDGDIAAAAGIQGSKLADNTVDASKIVDGSITNNDINAAAGISGTKLADNSVDASKIVDGSITNNDIHASANISGSKLADNSVPASKLSGGVSIPAGSIDSTHIANDSIMNVDVNAAAGILGSKLGTGSVTALQLGANAATKLTYAALGSVSTSGATAQAIATLTVPSWGGGGGILMAVFQTYHTVSAVACTVDYSIDSATSGGNIVIFTLPTANQGFPVSVFVPFAPIAAGSHTFRIFLQMSNASNWNTNFGYIAAVELLR